MLNCAEQVQIQKYETHACKPLKTAGVQTIMMEHQTKQLGGGKKKRCEGRGKPMHRDRQTDTREVVNQCKETGRPIRGKW